MLLRASPILLLSACLVLGAQAQEEQPKAVQAETQSDLASIYEDVFFSYQVWPPMSANATVWKTKNATRPIEVVLGLAFVSIDTIDPGDSEFTVTSRQITYYKEADCNQTETHRDACSHRIGNQFKFIKTDRSIPGSASNSMRLDIPNAHSQAFASRGLQNVQPSAEFVDNQVTYKHTFDMRTYPFEFHNLEVSYTAAYSSNVVKLSQMPSVDPGIMNPSVPPGWRLEGVDCKVGISNGGRAIAEYADGTMEFYNYLCTIQVSRENAGWWMTSFLIFCALIIVSFIGGLGVTSRYVADARDDKEAARRAIFDGTRVDGTFTVGLLLTFVFQVEISPYGQPIEFWPRIPTSSFIYVIGLLGITAMSGTGLIGSILCTKLLKAGGFDGGLLGAYDMDVIPKEGSDPEEDMPLVLKRSGAGDSKETSDGNNLALISEPLPMVRNTTPDTAEATMATIEHGETKIARSRKNNQKAYTVLSVEEAVDINKFIRFLLTLKVILLSLVFLAALIILSIARASFNDLVRNAV